MTTATLAEGSVQRVRSAVVARNQAPARPAPTVQPRSEADEDQALMRAAQAGEPTAFNHVVERFGVRMLRFLECFVGDRARARDLAQESFLRLHGCFRGHENQRDGNGVSLLYTIAANLGRDELRRRKARRETSLQAAAVVSITESESRLERDERQEQVMRSLAELDDDARLLLVMREIQDMSYDEIAAIQQVAIGTIKSRISRARLAFRDIWCRHQRANGDRSPS
ncbi:MAG: sigma-70 family RNA polymerase sigma factor [Planctomycetota bacterium]